MNENESFATQYIQKATIVSKIASRLRELNNGAEEGTESAGLFMIYDLLADTSNGVDITKLGGVACANKDICPFFEKDEK